MRALVCGGRRFGEMPGQAQYLFKELDRLHSAHGFECIIEGGALGADNLAAMWASTRTIPCEQFDADWGKHGKAAGAIRNREMLIRGLPGMVIAFPGGSGTANMIAQANMRHVPVTLCNFCEDDFHVR